MISHKHTFFNVCLHVLLEKGKSGGKGAGGGGGGAGKGGDE